MQQRKLQKKKGLLTSLLKNDSRKEVFNPGVL